MQKHLHFDALVAEIGSTTTLVSAFDGLGSCPRFVGQGMAPTTSAQGDVTIGLRAAIESLKETLDTEEIGWEKLYAASSAAGGLSMSVHGLVYDMTARAAHLAALGAGAVVRQVTAGKMGPYEQEALRALRPNLILLAGGTDFGDRETALHNARRIASLRLSIPTLYAGNREAAGQVKDIFMAEGQPLTVIDNVYPRLDELNTEPARRAIQDLFEVHITGAPGMAHIREMVGGTILPTPGAVMEALRLLHPVLGDLMAVDVGGATTDVHSAARGSEAIERIQTQPEPYFKRTVEGDLGTYLNARTVCEQAGQEKMSRELGFPVEEALEGWPPIPRTERQFILADRLAREAAALAVTRHAGTLRQVFLPEGPRRYAQGKDLSEVKTLIATGGALTRLPGRKTALRNLRDLNASGKMLYPAPGAMRVLCDARYLMAPLGVLSRDWPEAALTLLLDSLKEEDLDAAGD